MRLRIGTKLRGSVGGATLFSLIARIKKNSLKEHLRFRLPAVYNFVTTFERFRVFRNTKSDLSLKSWLYWILSNKHKVDEGFELSNYGVWLGVRQNDLTYNFAVNASYMNNLEKILLSLDSPLNFVDIGANIGIFSMIATKNPFIKEIYAFEPDRESFQFLTKNAGRNLAINIRPFNFAIGTTQGVAYLSKIAGHSGISKIIKDPTEITAEKSQIKMINQNFLDEVLDDSAINYFVKIDVEGYEFEVLQTLLSCKFFSKVEYIYLEFDIVLGKVPEVTQFLTDHNFHESGRWGKHTHWDALWERS